MSNDGGGLNRVKSTDTISVIHFSFWKFRGEQLSPFSPWIICYGTKTKIHRPVLCVCVGMKQSNHGRLIFHSFSLAAAETGEVRTRASIKPPPPPFPGIERPFNQIFLEIPNELELDFGRFPQRARGPQGVTLAVVSRSEKFKKKKKKELNI